MQIKDRNKEEMEEHTYKTEPGINIIRIIMTSVAIEQVCWQQIRTRLSFLHPSTQFSAENIYKEVK